MTPLLAEGQEEHEEETEGGWSFPVRDRGEEVAEMWRGDVPTREAVGGVVLEVVLGAVGGRAVPRRATPVPPYTINPKPQTLNPESWTINPEPEILTPFATPQFCQGMLLAGGRRGAVGGTGKIRSNRVRRGGAGEGRTGFRQRSRTQML